MKHLQCEFCDGETKTKLVSVKKKREGKTFNLEMKAEVCPNCKTKYYDGAKLQEFEKSIKKQLATV
jgi:YgiT-type zinc finger domain-containing protein